MPRPGANRMTMWVASGLTDTRIEAKLETEAVDMFDDRHEAGRETCWVGHNVSARRTIWGSPAIVHCDTRIHTHSDQTFCAARPVKVMQVGHLQSGASQCGTICLGVHGGKCTVDVLPSDGGHAVRFHCLSDGDNLGGVADVVVGIWMWLERLSAVAVCAPGVPTWRSEQSSSTGMAG